ncbi:MAG: glycosyltransferase family 4 protein [Saprospiraceae bacterium]|nr:glycosyltransferase family 4 protein [Saprospiraceae bacterium]
MQIIHIIPGSGGNFYCGNCLRDVNYLHELRLLGHEVIKVPMYLPLFKDEHDLEDIPVFYGAISLYLKQKWPSFQLLPNWFDKILNSKPALKFASSMAGTTRAKGLEELTMSMLLGESGQQAEELDKMVTWITEHCQPDVIHLSNALLLGLAHQLKERLNVPVICSLQDEDVWVDNMHPEFSKRVWALINEKATQVDAFISVSDYYTGVMQEKLNLSDQALHRLHLGVDPEEYSFRPASEKPGNIGFISQMSYGNGLDILVDAFIELSKNPETSKVKLILTGGHTHDDARFIREQKRKLREAGILDKVEFHENFTGEGREEFFEKVAVVSVPVRNGEAFGLYLLEALASGATVVQPRLGAFPEIIGISGGGITYEPNHPVKLATALKDLLFDHDRLCQLSKSGREAVIEHFHIKEQASQMLDIYEKLINKHCHSH